MIQTPLTPNPSPARGKSEAGGGSLCPVFLIRFAFCLSFLASALLVVGCGSSGPGDATSRPTATPTEVLTYSYNEASCAFAPPEGEEVVCGWLTVPENRSDRQGRNIRLHVAIVKSRNPHPAPDPLVFLAGGPGERAVDAAMGVMTRTGRVLAERDVIVFDQRGAGYSQPSLDCPEHDLAACRDRLVREGADLAGYTNNENADDVNDLRLALGYDKVNLYGGSYGTLLGLTVMRRHPEAVRSAVLDSVVPPQISMELEEARLFEESLNVLFDACAADLECNTTYPNLRDVFLKLVGDLNDDPAVVHVEDEAAGVEFEATLTGGSFAHLIWLFTQYTEALPYLPRLIYRTSEGDLAPLSDLLRIQALMPDRISEGMQLCVNCSCMTPFESPEAMREAMEGLHPDLRGAVMWPGYEACEIWKVPQAGPRDREPVKSDIPALLLSGRFDPLTPPSFADLAAGTLENHYSYVFPATGHGVVRTSDCAWEMIADFLGNPTAAPDDACLRSMPDVQFVTSSE